MTAGRTSRRALGLVVLLGFVSLFADITYEGARSIVGPYLQVLGASAAVVGVVAGLGEFVGYVLRLGSGYLADRTRRYWTITLVGYAINLLAVPALALTGRWETAAVLIVLERTGKALRTPARDAILSHATAQLGRGWGFGLHEAMDQIGAILGPAIVAGVLMLEGDYRLGFAVLAVPALFALATLVAACLSYPRPGELEVRAGTSYGKGFSRPYWLYLAAAGCVAAGFMDFPLIAYHFEKIRLLTPQWIPLLYAFAMAVDAGAALFFGWLFDRVGFWAVIAGVVISAFFAPLIFWGGLSAAVLGLFLWGIGMGAQESIIRAAVGALVPPEWRGTAYGIFNAGYGMAWFAGSALMGILYDVSLPSLVAFSVLTQLASVPLLLWVIRTLAARKAG